MLTPSPSEHLTGGEVVPVRLTLTASAVVFPIGGLALVITALLTGLHDWEMAIAVGIGGAIGYSIALAAGLTPALRATKQRYTLVDQGTVELRSTAATTAPAPIVLLAIALYFGAVSNDLATPGAIAVGIGSISWFEVRAVRHWELEHDALLASAVRPRGERLKHPFRSPATIGIRVTGSDPHR